MKYQVNKRAIHQNYFSGGSPLMEKKSWWNRVLDTAQHGLSAAGMVPGFGAIPDALNSLVSGGRIIHAKRHGLDASEYAQDLAFNMAAIVPGAGQAATLAKYAHKGSKIAKGLVKADKALASASVVKGLQNIGKAAKYTVKGKKIKGGTEMLRHGKAFKAVGGDTMIEKGARGIYNFGFKNQGLVAKSAPKAVQAGAKVFSGIGAKKAYELGSDIAAVDKQNKRERMDEAIIKNIEDPNKVYAGDSDTNPKPTIRSRGMNRV